MKHNVKELSLRQIIYIAVAAVTAVMLIALLIWASLGVSGDTLTIVESELVFNKKLRTEYFLGEDIETTGIELRSGKNTYLGEDLTFTFENETAGEKMVEVSHTEDGNYYRAYFPVKYFAIRHFDVHRAPTGFTYDNVGNITGLFGLELWAELSSEPLELKRPLENHHYSTVIELTPDQYNLELSEDEFGGTIAAISCAGKTVDFYFIEINGSMVALNSSARVLSLKNVDENGARLTLFVTQVNGENGAAGWYIYERTDGTSETFFFRYHLEGWTSHFESNNYDWRIYEEQVGDDYKVVIDGITFLAGATDWHRAILNS